MLSFSHYLCRCDAYTEDENDHIMDHKDEDVVTLESTFPHYGKRCRTGGILREFDCFDKCYPISIPGGGYPVPVPVRDEAAADKPSGCDDVFWAITCSGKYSPVLIIFHQ